METRSSPIGVIREVDEIQTAELLVAPRVLLVSETLATGHTQVVNNCLVLKAAQDHTLH